MLRRRVLRFAAAALATGACAGAPVEATTTQSATSTGETTVSAEVTTSGPLESSSSSTDPSTTVATTATQSSSSSSSDDSATTASSSTGDGESSTTEDIAPCRPLLHEALNDPISNDDMLEWVEIYNPCDVDIDLRGFSLAWGGTAYTETLDLQGVIAAQGCFVVGGPNSTADNANPVLDQAQDFDRDLENATSAAADGIALFPIVGAEVDANSVPVDALIYGDVNENGLVDESGEPGAVDVEPGSAGTSLARVDPAVAPPGGAWVVDPVPTPGVCPNPM